MINLENLPQTYHPYHQNGGDYGAKVNYNRMQRPYLETYEEPHHDVYPPELGNRHIQYFENDRTMVYRDPSHNLRSLESLTPREQYMGYTGPISDTRNLNGYPVSNEYYPPMKIPPSSTCPSYRPNTVYYHNNPHRGYPVYEERIDYPYNIPEERPPCYRYPAAPIYPPVNAQYPNVSYVENYNRANFRRDNINPMGIPQYLPMPSTPRENKVSPVSDSKMSKSGLWCHQCKKKNRNIVYCSKYCLGFCSKKYCKRCIEKHYNENFDSIDKKNWICMFCRGLCLCASCRRKRGEIVPKRIMKNKRKAEGNLPGEEENNKKRRKNSDEQPETLIEKSIEESIEVLSEQPGTLTEILNEKLNETLTETHTASTLYEVKE